MTIPTFPAESFPLFAESMPTFPAPVTTGLPALLIDGAGHYLLIDNAGQKFWPRTASNLSNANGDVIDPELELGQNG